MSSISVLQAPGLGSVAPAKPSAVVTPEAPLNAAPTPAASGQADTYYPSPSIRVDPSLNTVIIEYRDARTGDETSQFPSKAQLELYELNQKTSGSNPKTPSRSDSNGA